MASTVNVKNRVLAELSNAVPNDKVKRKPLATITIPAAKTEKIDNENVTRKVKADPIKKAPLCEKENDVVEKLAKTKDLKDLKDHKDSKEVKVLQDVKESKESKNVKEIKEIKDVVEVLEVKEVQKVEEIEVKEVSAEGKIEVKVDVKIELKVDEKVEVKVDEKIDEQKEDKVEVQIPQDEEAQAAEIVDKENIENEIPSPAVSDVSIRERNSPISGEVFGAHEDDWCFSKMLFLRSLEYEEEIQKYLLRLQVKRRPDPCYMARHKPEINEKMRTILVDWMVEVVEEYKMTSETLFLAVNFIDRFLSNMTIARGLFQLLGTTALFISSKYEEIYPPDIHEFVYITDNAYEALDILSMEGKILKALDFNVSTPTAVYFLRKHLCTGIGLDLPQTVGIMAEYLCYLSLLDVNPCTSYLPNDIAVSAIILSASLFGITIKLSGESGQVFFPGFTKEQLIAHVSELQSCIDTLHHLRKSVRIENDALLASGKPHQAVFSKFAQEKYFTISLLGFGSEEAPKIQL